MWLRWRGLVWAGVLVLAVVGAGVAGAQVQAETSDAAPAPARAKPRDPSEVARMTVLLSRMHHAADREAQLGDLAHVNASLPETRRYGIELAADFRAFDQRVVAFAARNGIDEDRLAKAYAGENVVALRREAEELSRLGGEKGERFDRRFWVTVAHEQSAASDMLTAAAAVEPELLGLVADMSRLLDRFSRKALKAAQPVLAPSPPASAEPEPSPAPER
jgi:hypothetical protein